MIYNSFSSYEEVEEKLRSWGLKGLEMGFTFITNNILGDKFDCNCSSEHPNIYLTLSKPNYYHFPLKGRWSIKRSWGSDLCLTVIKGMKESVDSHLSPKIINKSVCKKNILFIILDIKLKERLRFYAPWGHLISGAYAQCS